MQFTDTEIVKAIREGNEQAFEQLFRAFYERLCQYAHSIIKDADDAEEVVQTIFLNLWEKRNDFEIALSLKAYLYRAVHNHCLNRIKHLNVREAHKSYSLYYQADAQESIMEAIYGNELEDRIERAVSGLPEQCQRVFRMSRFDELKYQEIADELGVSIKTVENQIGKALRILRSELTDYLPVIFLYLFFIRK